MQKVDVETTIFLIGLFFCIFIGIFVSNYNELKFREQYMNNLTIVINCRKSYGLNNLTADRICGPVPQWATYDRRTNQ
jgi:hypothetical protein